MPFHKTPPLEQAFLNAQYELSKSSKALMIRTQRGNILGSPFKNTQLIEAIKAVKKDCETMITSIDIVSKDCKEL